MDALIPTTDVLVVGAGISGLVAATELQRAGLRVLVLDKESAAVLEVTRPLAVRLQRLVRLYGGLDPAELAEATVRISRRLGPQRTATALAAIGEGNWALAAEQMLDYYDRCYDHELGRRSISHLGTLDLNDLDDDAAAECLLRHGSAQGAA
jgi:tRNA 2-selenouridine synthase